MHNDYYREGLSLCVCMGGEVEERQVSGRNVSAWYEGCVRGRRWRRKDRWVGGVSGVVWGVGAWEEVEKER